MQNNIAPLKKEKQYFTMISFEMFWWVKEKIYSEKTLIQCYEYEHKMKLV